MIIDNGCSVGIILSRNSRLVHFRTVNRLDQVILGDIRENVIGRKGAQIGRLWKRDHQIKSLDRCESSVLNHRQPRLCHQ